MKKNFCIACISVTCLLHADEQLAVPQPWLTGPLIAPPGVVVPVGHFDIEPYLYVNVNTGTYNSHWHSVSKSNFYNVNFQVFTQVGLTKWMDFQITPAVIFNSSQGKSSSYFGDLPIGFDFQLYSDTASKWFPGVRLGLKETFPTGKYQRLDPDKKGTDQTGLGTYSTNIALVFYKLYQVQDVHFLSSSLSFSYSINSSVKVHGNNAYGGGEGTVGTVYPGNIFVGMYSFEYTFTQNWVFACDSIYTHINKSRFSGQAGISVSENRGIAFLGSGAVIGGPSSEQISFSPSIEYNFSSHVGIIAGCWFTAWGRNSTIFRSAVMSLNVGY